MVVAGSEGSDTGGLITVGFASVETFADWFGGVVARDRRSIKEAVVDVGGLGVLLYLTARSSVRPNATAMVVHRGSQ